MEYPVELYEALHRGNTGDIEFYQRVTNTADSILELGCGYGRILVQLGGLDRVVWGIECHLGLLERAQRLVESRRKDPKDQKTEFTLIQADMGNFELGRQFDCIIVPYNGLYYSKTEEELRLTLCCARKHLQKRGTLAFDVYAVDDFHQNGEFDAYDDSTIEHVGIIEALGVQYSVYESSLWNRETQEIEVRYLYVPSPGDEDSIGAPIETRIRHRYFLSDQICVLLKECGFEYIEFHGDFVGSPFNGESELLVVNAM